MKTSFSLTLLVCMVWSCGTLESRLSRRHHREWLRAQKPLSHIIARWSFWFATKTSVRCTCYSEHPVLYNIFYMTHTHIINHLSFLTRRRLLLWCCGYLLRCHSLLSRYRVHSPHSRTPKRQRNFGEPPGTRLITSKSTILVRPSFFHIIRFPKKFTWFF